MSGCNYSSPAYVTSRGLFPMPKGSYKICLFKINIAIMKTEIFEGENKVK